MMESIVHNPVIPYNSYINGGFPNGRFVRVQGTIKHNANSLKINLMCGPSVAHDDIPFHLDARFAENVIVRNAKNHSNWGTEERHGDGFNLSRTEGFEIMILCDPLKYKIAINGQHYTEFNHRIPADRISHIGIEGDADLSIVQFDGNSNYLSEVPTEVCSPSAPLQFNNPGEYGGSSYPPAPNSFGGGQVGFVPPPPLPNYTPQQNSAYPSNPVGYQPFYPHQGGQGYYPPQGPPGPGYGYPPQGPGYGPPPAHYDSHISGYPPPPGPYQNQGYPGQSGSGGGIMGSAQKLLAGVGLAGIASKIPGMIGGRGGGHGQGQHYGGGYPGHHAGGSGGGFPGGAGGVLGSAAALGVGGALAAKILKPKKMKKNKLLKYGLPLAGVGVGGYAVHKGMKGFRRGSWSGSSSSSSSD